MLLSKHCFQNKDDILVFMCPKHETVHLGSHWDQSLDLFYLSLLPLGHIIIIVMMTVNYMLGKKHTNVFSCFTAIKGDF